MLKPRLARLGLVVMAAPTGILLAAGIIALHAALLPEGHWQGDDFICSAYARDFGLRYLWFARIDGWSPRPLSELLFYVYGRIAGSLQRPLTVPFLALLWTLLVATTLVTMRRVAGVRVPGVRLLVGLAIACMFLLGHPVAEMFFWPAGAVAYLTTLAATTLVFFLLVDGRASSLPGVAALSASLTACAASSEAGAMAAAPLSLALAASLPARRRAPLLLLPPLLAAGFVFWTVAHHRMVSSEAAQHVRTLQQMLRSLRPVPGALLDDIRPLWLAKLFLVLGLRWCWTRMTPAKPPPGLAAFSLALMLGAAIVAAAGVFQFGTLCCERHDTLRQCWLILVLAALALASARWPASPGVARFGPIALSAACLIGVVPRLGAMLHDFRLMPAIVASTDASWQSGRRRDSQSMVFQLPPAVALAGAVGIPAGRYTEPAANAWTAHGILQFFGKRSITIQPP